MFILVIDENNYEIYHLENEKLVSPTIEWTVLDHCACASVVSEWVC